MKRLFQVHLTAPRSWRINAFALLILFAGFCVINVSVQPQLITAPVRQSQKSRPSVSEKEMQEARELLDELGYWVMPDVRGLDVSLRHALIAFQKIEARKRTGILTRDELSALRLARRPAAIEIGYPHIEVDLKHQVLIVVDYCGAILRILPISSGNGDWFTEGGHTRRAVTPIGRFTVRYQIRGWHKSALGLLYYPNYIFDGIAIHGNPSVPVVPASHGCIRIPMFAAREFSKLALPGMRVLVHEGIPLPPPEPLQEPPSQE
jgi:L,D-transpeptidase catalytic domain